MNWKQVLTLLLVCSLFAVPGILRELPYGADSLYFFGMSCGHYLYGSDTTPILSEWFFTQLPCSELLFKLLPIGLLFICSLLISLIAELFDKKNGWMAGFFALCSIMFIQKVFQFEDDNLSFPFWLGSLWFYIKAKQEKKFFGLYGLIAVGLVGVAGLFWKGAVLLLVPYFIGAIISIPLFAAVLLWFKKSPFDAIAPNTLVAENVPLWGIVGHLWILLGALFIPSMLWFEAGIFATYNIFSSKMAFFLTPFLCIGLVFLVEKFKHLKDFKNFYYLLGAIPLICMITIYFAYPYGEVVEVAKYSIAYAQGKTINNYWDIGYLINYLGGHPLNFGGYGNRTYDGLLLVSNQEQIDSNILKEKKLVKKWDNWELYE